VPATEESLSVNPKSERDSAEVVVVAGAAGTAGNTAAAVVGAAAAVAAARCTHHHSQAVQLHLLLRLHPHFRCCCTAVDVVAESQRAAEQQHSVA